MQQRIYKWNITDEKYINDQIFQNYFKHENPLFLVKALVRAKQDKNE